MHKGRILITGGLGFIGSGLAMCLLENGYDVSIIDFAKTQLAKEVETKLQETAEKNKVSLLVSHSDIIMMNRISTLGKLDIKNVTTVVHCAAFKSIAMSIDDPIGFYHNNVCSTLELLKVCQEYDNIKKFIFSSTAAVYDPKLWFCTEEEVKVTGCDKPYGCQTKNSDPYSGSKLIDEQLIKEFGKKTGKEIIIFRYFNPIGSYKKLVCDISDSMFGNGFRAVENNEIFHIFGGDYDTKDGTCLRDYVDLRDIIDAHIRVIVQDYPSEVSEGKVSPIFNLGTGIHLSVLDCCKIIKKFVPDFKWDTIERRQGDGVAGIAIVEKMRLIYGWTAKYTVENTIKDYLNIK